jgi:hypothetical protein
VYVDLVAVAWTASLEDPALLAVLYNVPLHGAVMAHGMTGPHHSRRPIDLRAGIGIGSLRPVARPQDRLATMNRINAAMRSRVWWRAEPAAVVERPRGEPGR